MKKVKLGMSRIQAVLGERRRAQQEQVDQLIEEGVEPEQIQALLRQVRGTEDIHIRRTQPGRPKKSKRAAERRKREVLADLSSSSADPLEWATHNAPSVRKALEESGLSVGRVAELLAQQQRKSE